MGPERSSRGLRIFRRLIVLFAVGLLALVVQRSSSHPANADWLKLTTGHGRTAQGLAIQMRFDRPAHPLALTTRVRARCANGASWTVGWSAFDGTAAAFRRDGRDGRGLRLIKISDHTLRDGTFAQAVLSMGATLGPGARQARGWVRLSGTFTRGAWSTTCDSGRVPFAIDAPLASTRATSARPS
jgi:hypothetical protein